MGSLFLGHVETLKFISIKLEFFYQEKKVVI